MKNVYLFYYQVYASIGYACKPLYSTLIVLFFSYQLGEDNIKLLHVPIVNKATGENISNVLHVTVMDWKCENNVSCMVFDTTSSNTGRLIIISLLLIINE